MSDATCSAAAACRQVRHEGHEVLGIMRSMALPSSAPCPRVLCAGSLCVHITTLMADAVCRKLVDIWFCVCPSPTCRSLCTQGAGYARNGDAHERLGCSSFAASPCLARNTVSNTSGVPVQCATRFSNPSSIQASANMPLNQSTPSVRPATGNPLNLPPAASGMC